MPCLHQIALVQNGLHFSLSCPDYAAHGLNHCGLEECQAGCVLLLIMDYCIVIEGNVSNCIVLALDVTTN